MTPDPLLYDVPLPHTQVCFPLGHGLKLATNSPEVAAAAHRMWSGYSKLSPSPPVTLHVAVSDRRAQLPAGSPLPRGQGHLISIVHGTENFAVCDLGEGFSFAWLSGNVASEHPDLTRYFLETLGYLMLVARHFALIHASCVSLNGRGILLCGDSGAGKTCLAYALARRGWTFVSGDTTQLPRNAAGPNAVGLNLVGRPESIHFRETARDLFPELGKHPARPTLGGKMDIEAATCELNIETELCAEADSLIFLDRALDRGPANRETTTRSVHPGEVTSYLEQMIFFGDPKLRAEQRRTLEQLLTVPAFRLTYRNFDEAEELLRLLVNRS